MRVASKKTVWISVFALLFLLGAAGGYLYFSTKFVPKQAAEKAELDLPKHGEESLLVKVYYPSAGRLIMEERRVKRLFSQIAISEAIIEEFLRGPSDQTRSGIPGDARLLAVYTGNDGILYVDLSDECRRNFQGDALAEFLFLKGLYESIISNVQGIDDVKVIVEGKETESIGGHLSTLYPLKGTLTEPRE